MPSNGTISRRRTLAATSGVLGAVLAGCAGESESESSSTAEFNESDGAAYESTHEYEVLSVRSTDDEHFVHPSKDEASAEDDADDRLSPRYRRTLQFVLDEDEADALWIEDDRTDGDVRDLREFVDATDFDTQTIVIDQRTIDDCYERRVRGVLAESDSLRTRYCQRLKPPETPCEADKTVMEAVVFRIERSYEESPSSRGSSEGMSCRGPVVATRSDAHADTVEGSD
ncbi:hypothetical protein GS429_20220 [Natronorubrum sp. JWXQ-INN-674]|uniref:Uncharacterized protein n=1 Tax=Natronorubrum halalkaliphilum TaxID=2691917 RepID=A0A6B0VR90_9EURY|nr:hypothetical protein [Natronorubrum halalkaliphilum]MXV64351.1 hypothetical protein [Natronorubrum halalkaliphilum]